MREVEIKLNGVQNLGETIVSVDDKPLNFKKNRFGNLVCNYQTENEKANIKVYTMLDVGGVLWFLTQLFFFIISVFGIFDVHYKKRCLLVDFEAEVDLKDKDSITLQFNTPIADKQAINIQTDLTTKELSNKYTLDTKAKKTLKWLLLAKVFLALAIIALITIVLMIKL